MENINLEDVFNIVLSGEKSLTVISKEIGIPRTTLTRMIEKQFKDDIRYEEYSNRLKRNNHSGGHIKENETTKIYGNQEDLKTFFLEYCSYKKQGLLDEEIIKNMNVPKSTFYRRIKSYKYLIIEGNIELKKQDLENVSDEVKEELLFGKFNFRRKSQNIKTLDKEQFNKKLDLIKEIFISERKDDSVQNNIQISDLYNILYSNVGILSVDIEKRIRPAITKIDSLIGRKNANIILRKKPFFISNSIQRIEELLYLVKDIGILDKYIYESERLSPERIYAITMLAKKEGYFEKNLLRRMNEKSMSKYSKEELLEMYPYPNKYKNLDLEK